MTTPPPDGFPTGPPSEWPARVESPVAAAPAPPPTGGRGVVPIVALAVAFAVLVTFGIGKLLVDQSTRTAEPAQDMSSPDPGGTALPPTPTVSQAFPSLVAFVERERQRQFRPVPPLDVLLAREYETTVGAWVSSDATWLAERRNLDHALGAAGPAEGADQVYRRWAAGLPAAYDPDTGRLAVQGTAATPFVRARLVNELTRALDDQAAEAGGDPPTAPSGSEDAFARRALSDGSAGRVRLTYVATLSSTEQRQVQAAELATVAPQGLRERLELESLGGLGLVARSVAARGPGAVDGLVQDPPATSEQVLAAGLDPFRSSPIDVAPPPPDPGGLTVTSLGFGLGDWALITSGWDGSAAVTRARSVTDWGGGAATAWRSPSGKDCVSARIVGDSASATDVFAESLRPWSATVPGANLVTGVDPRSGLPSVVLRSCT